MQTEAAPKIRELLPSNFYYEILFISSKNVTLLQATGNCMAIFPNTRIPELCIHSCRSRFLFTQVFFHIQLIKVGEGPKNFDVRRKSV